MTCGEIFWETSTVKNLFRSRIEQDEEWHIAYCPDIPGANGQGKSTDEAHDSLAEATALILEDRRKEGLRAVPSDDVRETVVES